MPIVGNSMKKFKQCDYQPDSNEYQSTTYVFYPDDPKPFVCQVCPKSFVLQSQIDQHVCKMHGDLFPFQCKNCCFGFSNQSKWKLHENKCKKRRYECHLCEDISSHKFNLKLHMRSKHTGETPFCCTNCPERFHGNASLVRHMKRHHNKTN